MLDSGAQAPGFTLPNLSGEPVSLPGGPVLLVFFKISCPTCQLTLPFLNRLAPHLPVVAISQDDAASTQEFLDHFKIEYPTLLDLSSNRYAVSSAYRITNVPSLFLIESDGKISFSQHGFVRADLISLAARFHVALFAPEERVPILKPG